MAAKSVAWIARYQVDAVRELMRMELPERKTADLLYGSTLPNAIPSPRMNTMPSALWTAYRNKAHKLLMQERRTSRC